MQKAPDARVMAWLDRQSMESIWITAITLFELNYGIALLAKGRRRNMLEAACRELLEHDLENRVLDFDSAAASEAAMLSAARHKAGRPVDIRDTQIAGIALARRASLATRNTRHFEDSDLVLIDPWDG
jgi:predicted nucleic acid-binding protein